MIRNKYVGFVYSGDSCLYCDTTDDIYYHVINGGWSFHYTGYSKACGKQLPDLLKIIDGMDYYGDYNKACEVIRQAFHTGERATGEPAPFEEYEPDFDDGFDDWVPF